MKFSSATVAVFASLLSTASTTVVSADDAAAAPTANTLHGTAASAKAAGQVDEKHKDASIMQMSSSLLQSATASSHSHHAHGRVLSSSADEEEYHPTWQLLYGTNFICVDEVSVTGKLVAPENIPVDAFLSSSGSSSGDVDAVDGMTVMAGSICDPDLERVKYTDAWCCGKYMRKESCLQHLNLIWYFLCILTKSHCRFISKYPR